MPPQTNTAIGLRIGAASPTKNVRSTNTQWLEYYNLKLYLRVKAQGVKSMFISRRRIRVDWGHCDPAGIVFYPNYFRWFDACTTALFENAGIAMPTLYRDHGLKGFPLLDARASFSGSSAFGDDLDCESSVSEWNAKTFTVHHRFRRDGTLL